MKYWDPLSGLIQDPKPGMICICDECPGENWILVPDDGSPVDIITIDGEIKPVHFPPGMQAPVAKIGQVWVRTR